jgi:phage terminase Nu1 subunit (DNA packaging protein)
MPKSSEIRWSLREAARQLDIPVETLRRGFQNVGIETGPRITYTPRECVRAWAGDFRSERTRETRAKADLLELKRKEREQELVAMSEAEDLVRRYLLPIRDQLISLPDAMCARCNPGDPELARAQLLGWAEDAMKNVRERET